MFVICLLVLGRSPVLAYDLNQTGDAHTTATVPQTTSTTSDTTAPSNPILVSPGDGSLTRDNRSEFVWRLSADDNSNHLTYTLYLNGVATYLGIDGSSNSTGEGYTARLDGAELRLDPTISLSDGDYDWYVSASDNAGNTSSSATWHLTIDSTPPTISLTDLGTYHDLVLNSDNPTPFAYLSFDLIGPGTVDFKLTTEPRATITLQFFSLDNQLLSESFWPSDSTGSAYPHPVLSVGQYLVSISAFDQAGNTTILPDFRLNLSQATIVITIPLPPGSSPLPVVTIPYTPITLGSLPATISKVTTSSSLPTLLSILLAITILLLIIIVWKRRSNLLLLTPTGHPIVSGTLYHSLPNISAPRSYSLATAPRGRLYIPRLMRYSTLTLRQGHNLYLFSLCTTSTRYTIVLG